MRQGVTARNRPAGARDRGPVVETLPPLVRGLLQPAAYDHAVREVRLLQTHISWVFLTGDFAYKVKKGVNLGFLDFSTIERRRHACEEELRLNRRLTADLYLDVVPITGTREAPRLGGEGAPIEYAVRMREFAQADQLDRRLAAGALAAGELEAFARDLAVFHSSAARARAGDPFGEARAVAAAALDSAADLQARARGPAEAGPAAALLRWLRQAPVDVLLAGRKRGGFVREVHGDLHLANLARWRGRVVPFDCIEFEPMLRWIDVINDAAFLVMDLIHRGATPLAYAFLNAYLEATGDYQGVRLLRFYLVYRALVRAKVAAIRRDAGGGDADADTQSVQGHLALAGCLAAARTPTLVLMHGFSGSGKTFASGALAAARPAVRIRSDVERKRLHGLSLLARSGSDVARGLYSPAATRATYDRLAVLAEAILAGGEDCIVDAAFLVREQRAMFFALARRLAVPVVIATCEAPAELLEQRVLARTASDASEAGLAVLQHQRRTADPLAPEELAHAVRPPKEKWGTDHH